jgi:hypothetical protein
MFPVLKQLERDQSEEPFGDLDSSAKLQLLRTLCDLLLCTKKYEVMKDGIDKSIETNKSLVQAQEAQIIKLLKLTEEEVKEKRKNNRVCEFKEVKTST